MNKNEQRIAIAEACGWVPQDINNLSIGEVLAYGVKWWRKPDENTITTRSNLPDYLNDLNAMHEAERTLVRNDSRVSVGSWEYYLCQLADVTAEQHPIDATADQRAEAFLRTLGLWEEDSISNDEVRDGGGAA